MQRNTSQRGAILESLQQASRPLSPEEVLEQARNQVPGLGIATVYRNIRRMVEEGQLHAVTLPDEPARYELAGKGHHHHFQCRRCQRVFDVHQCPGPGSMEALVPGGFRLESHEIMLYGLCDRCLS